LLDDDPDDEGREDDSNQIMNAGNDRAENEESPFMGQETLNVY
jgi:hypothetical protein